MIALYLQIQDLAIARSLYSKISEFLPRRRREPVIDVIS